MQSSHVVLYTLLLGIVVALILSFVQLHQERNVFRAFVPHYALLWYSNVLRHHKQQPLDFLAYLLCKNFHVLSVFPCDASDEDDVVFRTFVLQQPAQVFVGDKVWDMKPSDLLACPVTITPRFEPQNCLCQILNWRIHPFPRRYKIAKCETDYICQQWRKKKLRYNVWHVNRLTRKS
jgi:hypothetical protein